LSINYQHNSTITIQRQHVLNNK